MQLRPTRGARRVLLGLAAAAWLTAGASLHAQTKVDDPEAYKAAKQAAIAAFLDRAQSKEKRLEAAKNLGYPDDKTQVALLELAADRTQDDDLRWEALRRHPFGDAYLDLVLRILDDPKDGGEAFEARLIEDLGRRVIRPTAAVRQRVQTVLRKLLKDPRDKVRLNAYRVLVSNHDAVAVPQLVESMKGKEVPIPLAEAIDLLDLDGAVNHLATLRPYLDHQDPRVRGQAARALASDKESRAKIVAMAKDPQAPAEVRLHALRGLAREDDQFAGYAIPLMENPKEEAKVRQAAMHAFAGRMNYQRVEPANQVRFAQAVKKLADDTSETTDEGRKIRENAKQLLPHLQKSFPEVKKLYEKP